MSNVSIYDKSWLELVFEGKNKAYGAYQLRQQNPKTTMMALLGGAVFLFSVTGLGLFLSSFGEKPGEIIISCPLGPTITPVDVTNPKTEPQQPKSPRTEPQQTVEPTSHSTLVVTQTAQADEHPSGPSIPDTPSTNPGTGIGTGTDTPSTGGGDGTVVNAPILIPDNTPVISSELDRQPLFPGGMKKFTEYIIDNIERPEIDEGGTISVLMSFVVERDGTLTDIKVLESSDASLEKNAIRVLKSLKVKWAPGIKNGAKVRTLYKLPIKVVL